MTDTRRNHGTRYYATVTLEHRETGELRTFADDSSVNVADCLRRIVAPFDPAEWCVATVSTPESILNDLRGRTGRYSTEASFLGRAGLERYL